MKKFIAALFVTAASFTAYAQNSGWNISDVINKDKMSVGYIYHTYAVGTKMGAKPEKVAAGLRLVCSVKGKSDPILAVFWNGMLPTSYSQTVEISIDGQPVSKDTWTHDGSLLYMTEPVAHVLIDNMKTGRILNATWTDNSIQYKVAFDISTFKSKLGEFNQSCKTQL